MTMMGTNHFVSIEKARDYYFSQGYDEESFQQKLNEKEIVIGKPELKEGEVLMVNPYEGRYFIHY